MLAIHPHRVNPGALWLSAHRQRPERAKTMGLTMSGPTASTGSASSYKAATDVLSERDPVLRRLVAQGGPFQVDPPTETHFAALFRAILYQQLGRRGGTRHPRFASSPRSAVR